MKLIIVTGMSGAGKSIALNKLEDMGYFCVDNLPVTLADKLVDVLNGLPEPKLIALGIDCRMHFNVDELSEKIKHLRSNSVEVKLMFLDASDDMLVRRYGKTRRMHPLAKNGLLLEGIADERAMLAKVMAISDYIIDTTELRPSQLNQYIEDLHVVGVHSTSVMIRSFGFKRSIPSDADMVFDVRFIPNPYWKDDLQALTGLDKSVADYVKSFDCTSYFIDSCCQMIMKLLPNYGNEDKHRLNICFGCTGGQHRSVCVAEEVYKRLLNEKITVHIQHRDLHKDLYI